MHREARLTAHLHKELGSKDSIYHCWKFDISGSVVQLPCVYHFHQIPHIPSHQTQSKLKTKWTPNNIAYRDTFKTKCWITQLGLNSICCITAISI